MRGAHAFRRPKARAGLGIGLRYVAVMLFALMASMGHAQAMTAHSGETAIMVPGNMAPMACCDTDSGAAHATPSCAVYFAPVPFQMAQPHLRPSRHVAPCAAPARHGRTLAPPVTPPRHG